MTLSPYLAKLDPEQLRAATSIDGYNFVLAGAGSGKTSVLIARIAYMLEQGIQPENILLITFTNKAAKEMKDRVIKLLGEPGSRVLACTFHSFCANVLRKYAKVLNLENDFVVLDEADRTDAMDIAKDEYFTFCENRGTCVDTDNFPTNKNLLSIYAMMTNKCCPLDEAILAHNKSTMGFEEDVKVVIQRFIRYKSEHNAMDYDDLLNYTCRLFRQNPHIRKEYDAQYQYIMCDEFQDTNPIQNQIINLISQDYPNLMVVGDDNQSIYAFRYADINNILGFKDVHPGCKEFMLTTNYRSTQEIIDVANAMMEHATEGIPKIIQGTRRGKKPTLLCPYTEYEEAEWIVNDILSHPEIPRNEIAVICRGGRQTYQLEAALNRRGIDYNKYGGAKFMERAVIKDLLAFLRTLHNPKDEIAAVRLFKLMPSIGVKTAKKLAEDIANDGFDALVAPKWQKKAFYSSLYTMKNVLTHLKTLSLQDQLDYLVNDYYFTLCIERIDASNKKASVKNEEKQKLRENREDAEVLLSMTDGYADISNFLADVVLEATQKNDDSVDKINITTIHSAKGLQYHTVYIVDCIEGVTPRCPAGSKEDPEELRCMYVAITRAKERLVLLAPCAYKAGGQARTLLSHFISPYNVRETFNAHRI